MTIRSIASVGLLAGAAGIASVGYLDTQKLRGWDEGGVIPWQYAVKLKRSTITRELDAAIPASVEDQRLTADVLFPKRVKAKVGEKVAELAVEKEEADARVAKRVAEETEAGDKARRAAESEEARQRDEAAILREDQLVLLLLDELTS